MMELQLKEIEKYYGANHVLKNISFKVNKGERVGIVGQNGCGKSTLFKIISGIEEYDKGLINIKKYLTIGYLNQIPEFPEEFTCLDVLKSAFTHIYEIKAQLKILELEMSKGESVNLDQIIKKYGETQFEFERLGGYEIEEKISRVSFGLNITEELKKRRFNTLSGGEKTVIMLGKVLLQNPDILLLDEPTNHLDIKAIEWLEDLLCNYDGAVLLVCHDRYFLDKVVNKIIEIEDGSSNIFTGNYSKYRKEKYLMKHKQLSEYRRQQKKIQELETAVTKLMQWGNLDIGSDRLIKKAKSIRTRIEKMDKVEKPVMSSKKIGVDFKVSERLENDVIEVKGLTKIFDNKVLLKDLNFKLLNRDKVAITGKNGSGKSTLIKILLNEYKSEIINSCDGLKLKAKNIISFNEKNITNIEEYVKDSGTVKINPNVRIGYLAQHVTFENENYSLLEAVREDFMISEEEAVELLGKFFFKDDDLSRKLKDLSGGERSRFRLCQLTEQEINLLILDEPTNHLDIESKEMLELALRNYEGTIIIISHDRYFMNKIATRIIELKDNKLINYESKYEYFKNKKKENLSEQKRFEIKLQHILNTDKSKSKKNKLNKLNKEYQLREVSNEDNLKEEILKIKEEEILKIRLQEKIQKLELEIKEINEEISKKVNERQSNYEELDELYTKKNDFDNELNLSLHQWIKLEC